MSHIGNGKKRILVVDDEADIHRFFTDFLVADGYEVCCVYDWRAAVTQLTRFMPDLIILDIVMPEVDGYVLAETLKQVMDCRIPVLVYSALSRPEDIATAFSKGGNAFLCKPAPISELRKTITYLLIDRVQEIPRRVAGAVEGRLVSGC